jgi:hypothetical protein
VKVCNDKKKVDIFSHFLGEKICFFGGKIFPRLIVKVAESPKFWTTLSALGAIRKLTREVKQKTLFF